MYLNTLICLEENVAGYGKSNKGPSGHITIMSPGIIKCYVQNLRNLPKEYTVYLISKNENKAVRLGNINAEDTNKQTTWKVDLDNLQGSRLKGKDIDCAAVVVEGNTDEMVVTKCLRRNESSDKCFSMDTAPIPSNSMITTFLYSFVSNLSNSGNVV